MIYSETSHVDHNTKFELYASVRTLTTLNQLGFPTPISGDTLTIAGEK